MCVCDGCCCDVVGESRVAWPAVALALEQARRRVLSTQGHGDEQTEPMTASGNSSAHTCARHCVADCG